MENLFLKNVFDAVFPDIKEKLIKTAMESNIMNCIITFHQGTVGYYSSTAVLIEKS